MIKDKNRAVLEQHLSSINMMLPKVRQGSSGVNNRADNGGTANSGAARDAGVGMIKETI
jgi:hypothetical protein